MEYNIYAGLGGSFGGAKYVGTLKNSNQKEADICSYEMALEEYESYEGLHGLVTWTDCAEELGYYDPETLTKEQSQDINEMYQEEVENWIEYYSIPMNEDENIEKEEIFYLN